MRTTFSVSLCKIAFCTGCPEFCDKNKITITENLFEEYKRYTPQTQPTRGDLCWMGHSSKRRIHISNTSPSSWRQRWHLLITDWTAELKKFCGISCTAAVIESLRSDMERKFFPCILPFRKPQNVKSTGERSGEYAGQENGVPLEITRPGNFELRSSSVWRALCGRAPSCWNIDEENLCLAFNWGIT